MLPATRLERLSSHLCGGNSSSSSPTATTGTVPADAAANSATSTGVAARRLRIAAVVTEYRKYSHAQHICDRFLMGYGWGNGHHRPEMDLVGIYIAQDDDNHLGSSRAAEFPQMRLYPTISEALCLGGDSLAVDGVLLVGEHGQYEKNEKGQTLYPRYEFFCEIVKVFERSGRACPVFNDKHLSWRYDWAAEMVQTSKDMGFALGAGSSVPVSARLPSIDIPLGSQVSEVVAVGVGGIDSYDFHVLEALQSFVERRAGGESGVRWVQALTGDAVWEAAARAGGWDEGGWDPALFQACLCRSLTLCPDGGSQNGQPNHRMPALSEMPSLHAATAKSAQPAVAYRFEYADGLRGTMLLLNGVVGDMCVAANVTQPGSDTSQVMSTLMYLRNTARDLCNFFSPLCHHAEAMFATGVSPCPIERTLLTTGLVAAGVESLHRGNGQTIATPELLSIKYTAPVESTYMGAPHPLHGNPLPIPPAEPHPPSALSVHGRRLRVAVVGSIWGYSSHVDHISNRFLSGYPMNGEWHRPEMDIVSAWIHQTEVNPTDISAHRAEQFGFELYPSIREALCCGGDEVAVDCVLLIAEHGEYPTNMLGQKLYPRHLWFHEILDTLEASGSRLPIYCDKHLSYSFVEAERMVARAQKLGGIPILADSGLPFSWRCVRAVNLIDLSFSRTIFCYVLVALPATIVSTAAPSAVDCLLPIICLPSIELKSTYVGSAMMV